MVIDHFFFFFFFSLLCVCWVWNCDIIYKSIMKNNCLPSIYSVLYVRKVTDPTQEKGQFNEIRKIFGFFFISFSNAVQLWKIKNHWYRLTAWNQWSYDQWKSISCQLSIFNRNIDIITYCHNKVCLSWFRFISYFTAIDWNSWLQAK